MAVEMGIVKNLENQRVLVSQKNTDKNGETKERLYIVAEEKADKFMKSVKGTEFANKAQKNMSTVLAPLVGAVVALTVKTSAPLKILSGVVTGGAAFFACKKFDEMTDRTVQNQNLKHYKAQDVTGQDIDTIV